LSSLLSRAPHELKINPYGHTTNRRDHLRWWIVTHEVDLNPFMLEAEDYPELVEIEKQLTHAQARTVLVARKK